MNFENELNQLAEVFAAVQRLNIKPTRENVNLLSMIMYNLERVYAGLENIKPAEKKEEEEEHAS